jgi:hypothetical protein
VVTRIQQPVHRVGVHTVRGSPSTEDDWFGLEGPTHLGQLSFSSPQQSVGLAVGSVVVIYERDHTGQLLTQTRNLVFQRIRFGSRCSIRYTLLLLVLPKLIYHVAVIAVEGVAGYSRETTQLSGGRVPTPGTARHAADYHGEGITESIGRRTSAICGGRFKRPSTVDVELKQ